ncbi:hypothetical protein Ciccas_003539 [Cichlidogyrus casuarinus]|uniref:non-specific serine/threonine protein kinase n=1 Tax=Cichlidogyrus casuarinus TaxID=1844966 RepID=A0ABD2QE31_9PLAT
MEKLGFTRQDIEESLNQQLFNNVTATYLLLGRRKPGVQYARLTFPTTQSTGSLTSVQSGGPARKNSTPTPPASSGHNSAGSTISIGSRASSTPRFLAAQNNTTPSPSPLVVSGGQFTTTTSLPQPSSTRKSHK